MNASITFNGRRRVRDGWSLILQGLSAEVDGPFVRIDLDTAPWPVGLTPAQAREFARRIYAMAQSVDAGITEEEAIDLLREEAQGCA